MAKKDFDGDYDASVRGEVEARENEKSPKDMKMQTRGWTKSGSRKQKEPSNGFLKHTQKGKC